MSGMSFRTMEFKRLEFTVWSKNNGLYTHIRSSFSHLFLFLSTETTFRHGHSTSEDGADEEEDDDDDDDEDMMFGRDDIEFPDEKVGQDRSKCVQFGAVEVEVATVAVKHCKNLNNHITIVS